MENKYEDLKKELKDFENEKKKVKEIIGKIGGTHKSKTNIIINVVFLVCVVAVFILGAVLHKISMPLSLEIGVLLVSLKIAWMIHEQQKINHFQFWMLNSLEFRINNISKKMGNLEKILASETKYK
jgi:hypothetical protein